MAQRTLIQLLDDLDGSEAVETVTFGLDGTTYEIDLSEKNAASLRKALSKFVGVARKTSTGRPKTSGTRKPKSEGAPSRLVREWAKGKGIEVPERGRIPEDVRAQYDAAHNPAA